MNMILEILSYKAEIIQLGNIETVCTYWLSMRVTLLLSPTIVRGNVEDINWYRGDNESIITRIWSLWVFDYTEQLCNSKF